MSVAIALICITVFVLSLTALYAATLRYGPRRGYWNQPSAKLRAPTRKVVIALWLFAVAHVAVGFFAAVVFDAYTVSVFLVATLMGGFYAAMAMVMQLATLAQRRNPAAVDTIASGRRRKHDTVRSDD